MYFRETQWPGLYPFVILTLGSPDPSLRRLCVAFGPVLEQPNLLLERGMVLGNPVLDLAIKLLRLDEDLLCFVSK
jgi:hypothetical protein